MRVLLPLLAALLATACLREREPDPPAPADPAPALPWTRAFQEDAVLVADEIVIEGPSDLIDHVVLRADDETNVYTTKTITEGLLQELVPRPETGVELRGQLDAWSLAAFRRIRVLQRPGEVAVTVRARGKAYFARADGSGERRDEELVFRGVRGR